MNRYNIKNKYSRLFLLLMNEEVKVADLRGVEG
jgi:hypothetical protein